MSLFQYLDIPSSSSASYDTSLSDQLLAYSLSPLNSMVQSTSPAFSPQQAPSPSSLSPLIADAPQQLLDELLKIYAKPVDVVVEDVIPAKCFVIHQCLLCGVFLSPTVHDEILRHLMLMHRNDFHRQFVAWLRRREVELGYTNGERHPVWKYFCRVGPSDAVCTCCLRTFQPKSSSDLVRHLEQEHHKPTSLPSSNTPSSTASSNATVTAFVTETAIPTNFLKFLF